MNEPKSTLRVGLLVDSLDLPAWVERAVRQIVESGYADIVLLALSSESRPAKRSGIAMRLKYLLFDAYERFDRRWFSDARLDPFDQMNIAPLVAGVPRVEATTTNADRVALSPSTIAAIRENDLDVLLRLGFESLREIPRGIAKHGVWAVDASMTHGESGLIGGFWEVLRGKATNESTLDVLSEAGGEQRAIYRSFGSTSPVSVWKTRRERYWKAASFVARKLRDLSELGTDAVRPLPAPPDETGGVTPAEPDNVRVVSYLPRVAARYVGLQIDRRTRFDQWFVAYHFSSREPDQEGVPEMSFGQFTQLRPPRDRMWADPFPITHRGQHYLFLEELLFARNRGHISVVEFENEKALRPELVLETAHHLSYPFVLPWRGEMFLIPESARAGDSPAEQSQLSIPVFRARAFPSDWVQETAMLENIEVFDPTIAEIDGRWWLFCARGELGASTWDELHLFYASTPFGPWTPHRRNPVKSDVRSARPAGRLFRRNGEWYRPAQDCSVRYGYGMSINRITQLTPTEYDEVVVQHIAPDWTPSLLGTHTLNAAGRLTVIDANRNRWRWSKDSAPLEKRER